MQVPAGQVWPPWQFVQEPPPVPHAPADMPVTHWFFVGPLLRSQQPPLQFEWLPSPQTFSHTFVVALHASCGPQDAHVPPLPPHAVSAVPATQVPSEQQPPLQAELPTPQFVLHVFDRRLQALPAGQSPTTAHPQTPLTHALPFALFVQSAQAPPPVPHALPADPATHVPAEQQPPLQFV